MAGSVTGGNAKLGPFLVPRRCIFRVLTRSVGKCVFHWDSGFGSVERFRGSSVTRLMNKYRCSSVVREVYFMFLTYLSCCRTSTEISTVSVSNRAAGMDGSVHIFTVLVHVSKLSA